MPSSYTPNLGIEKPADGEQDGVWGDVVNDNMDILDRAINGSITLSLSGTTSTLTTTDGTLSDGQYKLIVLAGSPSGTHTITLTPNDAQKIYFVRNTTAQSVVFTQGSGGNVTLAAGDSGIIYSNGGGSTAAVVNLTNDFAMSSVNITGGAITNTAISGATVTGGTIDGTPVGGTTRASGAFTTLNANGTTTLSGALNASGTSTFSATTIISGQVGLGGTNYGTAGQVLTSAGAGAAPVWANSFPSGGIIMWSGSIVSIPSGWALCDGTNGTPDLRNRFVVGAGSTYAVGATGGSDSVTLSEANLPAHTHTFSGTTSTDGAHSHTISGSNFDNGDPGSLCLTAAGGYWGDTTTGTAGSHAHSFSGTTSSVGSGTAVENRPPYYALAYIMKV